MKAITRIEYGGPDTLKIENIEQPKPKAKELLIKVHACTINRTDCSILTGKPFIMRFFIGLFSPREKVCGTDFAGVVADVGEEVDNFSIGDRVWGLDDEGLQSRAEYMTIDKDDAVVKIHDGVSYAHAAASAEGAHYAFNFIRKVKINKGDKVLVNGATGAIGSAAVQMLKYFGCYVTAVANTKNLELMKTLGADKIYNWEKEDFTLDNEKYHYVLDAVGKSNFGKCKRLLRNGGIYISSELGPRAENLYLPLFTLFSKKQVKFPIPLDRKRSLLVINRMIREGKFKSVIDRYYEMEDISDAYKYVMSGQKTGNVILNINDCKAM